MNPILYEENETEFKSNGLGRLPDAVSCKVVEERNGQYELEMQYPITGTHYDDIREERIIAARHDDTDDIQPFRIYKITRPMNGIVTINARHISYQLSKVVVMPMTADNAKSALQSMKDHSVGDNPYEFWTDKKLSANFKITHPVSFRSFLGGTQGSILDIYGPGEYEWDKFTVKFHANRGSDSGVTIRYGKNLTDLKKTTNSANIWTGVVPYWYGMDNETETLVTLAEGAVYADTTGDYAYRMVIPLDLSASFENPPTEEQLKNAAISYVNANADQEIPSSMDISFVNLWQTEEYKNVAPLQRLRLCDTVTIHHRALGVEKKAKIVSVTYDVLLERYSTMTVGTLRTSLGESIEAVASDTQRSDVASLSSMEQAIKHAIDLVTGNLGGRVRINLNANGQPKEILFMDKSSVDEAGHLMRLDGSGISCGLNGYKGSFTTALSLDGIIRVMSGSTEKFFLNVATGALRLCPDSLTLSGGKTVEEVVTQAVSASVEDSVDSALSAAVSGAVDSAVSDAIPSAVASAVSDAVPTAVAGAVSSAVPSAVSDAMTALEATLPLDECGRAVLDENGSFTVSFNYGFAANADYFVFLQKLGEGDLYVSARNQNSFSVTGTAGLAFLWNMRAERGTP